MCLFEDLARVAYTASWIDCLFPKGVAQNGLKPDGSKSIADMHPVLKCLRMKEHVSKPSPPTLPEGRSHCRVLDQWVETTHTALKIYQIKELSLTWNFLDT